jgi:hypothetical protein
MVAYIFDKILAQGVRENQIPARTRESREWFRDKAAETTAITPNRLIQQAAKKEGGSALLSRQIPGKIGIGRMYMFMYDPKHKKDLPYYDLFPLIFKVKDVDGGFIGLNMHYLPPELRARLMDAMYPLVTDTRYDENTRLRLTYERLAAASRYRFFKPTLKMYLRNHVKSRFILVDSTEWDMALFLPTERFRKRNKATVWKESRAAIRGR